MNNNMSTGFNPDYLLGKASTEQKKQHLKGWFIRVNGLYYENHDGIINRLGWGGGAYCEPAKRGKQLPKTLYSSER